MSFFDDLLKGANDLAKRAQTQPRPQAQAPQQHPDFGQFVGSFLDTITHPQQAPQPRFNPEQQAIANAWGNLDKMDSNSRIQLYGKALRQGMLKKEDALNAINQEVDNNTPKLPQLNPIEQFVGGAVSTGQKAYNTAEAAINGVTGLAQGVADAVTHNKDAKLHQQVLDRQIKENLSRKTITGNQGSFLNYQQAQNKNGDMVGNFVKPILSTAAEVTPYVIPYGAITKAAAPLSGAVTKAVGGGLKGAIAGRAAQYTAEGALNAPIFAAQNAVQQGLETGKFDPIQSLQAGAMGGLMAGGGHAAGDIVGAGVRGVTNRTADIMANSTKQQLQGGYIGKGELNPTQARIQELQAIVDNPGSKQITAGAYSAAKRELYSLKRGGTYAPPSDEAEMTMANNYMEQMVSGASKPKPTSRQLPQSTANFVENRLAKGGKAGRQNVLPENYLHKRVGNIDKAFRSTRSIIELQGESGRQLAGKLREVRDTQEIYLAQLQKQMPTVTKLARKGRNALVNKDFENFVNATQGIEAPKNPMVAQAIKEWQGVHPSIRQRAVDAGLEVGDLGPQYYPHFIDYDHIFKDKNTYNQALNHLVESGQAANHEEAIKLLSYARDVSRNRTFGNLEASREVDLPFYDKTPNSFINYLDSSAKRIAQTEVLGKSDEQALKLIAKAGKEGYDTEAMKNAYDVAVGAKKYNPTSSAISGNIRKYITTTRLGLGALTNLTQNANTGIVTGHLRTLSAAVKQLNPKVRSFVEDTGVISDAVLSDLKTQSGYSSFSQKVAGKVVNKITAPGFGVIEKMNRSIAATAGRDYALRLAQKGDIATLKKLGVTGDIKNNTLTEAQQVQAARRIVEKTQFKVDPQDLPGWTDSPGGKLVSQFRTFSYNQSKFFSNEIIKPAAKGDLKPLGRLLAALPLGYAMYEAKRVINGRPEEEDKTKVALAAFQNVGGAGIIFDIYQSLNPLNSKYIPSDRRVTMAVGTMGGPAAGVAAQAAGAVSELIQRKNTPDDKSRLDGKLALGVNDDTYTDATQAARFALNQIPVIGGPIRNRVLPYKLESEADSGKPATGNSALANSLANFKSSDKAYQKEYQSTLSAKERGIANLTKTQQKQLIEQGLASQSDFDAVDTKINNLKAKYGKLTTKTSTKISDSVNESSKALLTRYDSMSATDRKKALASSNDAEYKYYKAKYENDKANGKISDIQDITRKKMLQRDKIGAKYSPTARDLYGLSKAEIYDYVSTHPNGQKLADELTKYDKDLYNAGLKTYLKFKTGIAPAPKRSSGGRKSSGTRKGSSRKGTGKKGGSKKSALPKTDPFKSYITTTASVNKKVASAKVAKKHFSSGSSKIRGASIMTYKKPTKTNVSQTRKA